MTKAHLVRHMVEHFRDLGRPMRRDDAREILDELERLCKSELLDVGQFLIPKIAKLKVVTRAERRGRYPLTGDPITIPARTVVQARVSSRIRAAIEGPADETDSSAAHRRQSEQDLD